MLLSIQNDWIYEALANIDFVMLPKCEQNYVRFMLHAAQHPQTMKSGMVQLNLATFVEVWNCEQILHNIMIMGFLKIYR